MPPNFELLPFLMFYYVGCHKMSFFNQARVQPNFSKDLKGALNQKRLKNTGLKNTRLIICDKLMVFLLPDYIPVTIFFFV